jgi:hypothetical protein
MPVGAEKVAALPVPSAAPAATPPAEPPPASRPVLVLSAAPDADSVTLSARMRLLAVSATKTICCAPCAAPTATAAGAEKVAAPPPAPTPSAAPAAPALLPATNATAPVAGLRTRTALPPWSATKRKADAAPPPAAMPAGATKCAEVPTPAVAAPPPAPSPAMTAAGPAGTRAAVLAVTAAADDGHDHSCVEVAVAVTDGAGETLAVTNETVTLGDWPCVACACVHAPPSEQLKAVMAVLRRVDPVAYTAACSTPDRLLPQAPPAVSEHVVTKVMTVLPPQLTLAPTLPGCSMRRVEHVTGLLTTLASTEEMLEVAGCGHDVPSGCARSRERERERE